MVCQCCLGVYLSLSANDNIEQWRDHSVLCQIYGGYIVRCTRCHTDISLYLPISWGVTLTFPFIFLLLDCFEFALIDYIEKQRAHSELWQFWMGGFIVRCTWCHTDISLYLPISWGVTLTFPYIFLLLDCFKFARIDCIEKQRVHPELWQFQTGGYVCLWVSMTTFNSEEITLWSASVGRGVYLSVSANDNIEQWRDHSVLCQIYGGVYCKMYLVSHWHFIISSY